MSKSEATKVHIPPVPKDVSVALDGYSDETRDKLLEVRRLVYAVAHENPEIGELTETLKWGEPAFLTEETKSGSTLRMGTVRKTSQPAIFVSCNTTMAADFKERFHGVLEITEPRDIMIPDVAANEDVLKECIRLVLTYHNRKRPKKQE